MLDPFREQNPKRKVWSFIGTGAAGNSRIDRLYVNTENTNNITNIQYIQTPFGGHKILSFVKKNKVDIFELVAGYTYKKDSGVTIKIGSQKFELFTSGGTAWAKTSNTDRALARAMKRGNTMTVAGTSSRGTKTLDTYSLKGFTAAYNAIGTNCKKK